MNKQKAAVHRSFIKFKVKHYKCTYIPIHDEKTKITNNLNNNSLKKAAKNNNSRGKNTKKCGILTASHASTYRII